MKIELDAKQKTNLLNRIFADYNWGKAELDLHTTAWDEARKQYRTEWIDLEKQADDENLDQWINVPKSFMVGHRILCAFLQHFLPRGRRKLGKVLPPTMIEPYPVAASIADKVLHAKMDLEGQPDAVLPAAMETVIVEGDGWVKGRWVREKVGKMRLNRPEFEWIENENLVRDPYALTDQDIRWVIHRLFLTEEELWRRQIDDIYENVGDVVKGQDEAQQDIYRQSISSPANKGRRLYEILEFWGPQQLLTDDQLAQRHEKGQHEAERDIVATVYQNKTVLRIEENDYAGLRDYPNPFDKLPFFKGGMLLRRGSTYSESLMTRIKPLQREINTLRNQRRIEVEAGVNRKIFFDQNRLTDLERLYRSRYGGYVPVNGSPRDVVYDWSPTNLTQGMVAEEQIMDDDLRDMTGATHYQTGSTVPGMQQTATGVSIVSQEGNAKFDTMIENLGRTLILPMIRWVLECSIEWVKPEEVAEILGHDIKSMPPDAAKAMDLKAILNRDFYVELEAGASATSKAVRIQQLQSMLSFTAQLANAMPQQAAATITLLMPELFNLAGLPEAAAAFNKTVAEMPQVTPPSGNQQEAPQNPGVGAQEAMIGRTRTPQEMRR